MRTDKTERVLNEIKSREADRVSVSEKIRVAALVLLACAYAVMWVGGVAQSFLRSAAGEDQGLLSALFLALAGTIVLISTRDAAERLLLAAVASVGFAAEVAGVHLGFPFGSYSYTEALGPKLIGVPLVMTFAWMTLAAYLKQMLMRFDLRPGIEMMIAAFWMTSFDLLIDPLAANQLGYWRWDDVGPFYGVPLTNFAGWFFVSLLAFGILRRRFTLNPPAHLTGFSIILFFTMLALAHDNTTVFLIGCALCAADLLLFSLTRRRHPPRP